MIQTHVHEDRTQLNIAACPASRTSRRCLLTRTLSRGSEDGAGTNQLNCSVFPAGEIHDQLHTEGSHNGSAAVLKTAGLTAVGVRVPHPPHTRKPDVFVRLLLSYESMLWRDGRLLIA